MFAICAEGSICFLDWTEEGNTYSFRNTVFFQTHYTMYKVQQCLLRPNVIFFKAVHLNTDTIKIQNCY
jgi:hypothetical protein